VLTPQDFTPSPWVDAPPPRHDSPRHNWPPSPHGSPGPHRMATSSSPPNPQRFVPPPLHNSSASVNVWSPIVSAPVSMSSSQSTTSTLTPPFVERRASLNAPNNNTATGNAASPLLGASARMWKSHPASITPRPPLLFQTHNSANSQSDTALMQPLSHHADVDLPFFAPSPRHDMPAIEPLRIVVPTQGTTDFPRAHFNNPSGFTSFGGPPRNGAVSPVESFDMHDASKMGLFFLPDTPKDPPLAGPTFDKF